MEITIRTVNDISIIDLEGEIDIYNVPEIRGVINKLIEQESLKILVNMEKVSYIDSSGIGALITTRSDLKNKKGNIKICCPNETVLKIFGIMNLMTLFEIFPSEADALKSFSS